MENKKKMIFNVLFLFLFSKIDDDIILNCTRHTNIIISGNPIS